MSAPSQESTKGWVGQPVHDCYDNVVGTCAAVIGDDLTGVVEWLDVQRPAGERSLVPANAATREVGFVRVAVAAHAVVAAPATSPGGRPDEEERARLHAHYDTAAPLLPPLPRQPAPPAAPPLPLRQPAPVAAPSPSSRTFASRLLPSLGAAAAAGLGVALAAALVAKVLRARSAGAPSSAVGSWRAPTSRPTSRRSPRSRQGRSSRSSSAGAGRAVAGVTAAVGTRAASGAKAAAASTGRTAVKSGVRAVSTGAKLSTRARRAVTPSRRRSMSMMARAFFAGRRSATISQRVRGRAVSAGTAVATPVTAAVTTIMTFWRISVGIIKNALVFGGGYVVGSRAGRERYQQLKEQGSALLQRPQVKQALQRVKGAVTGGASTAAERVKGKIASSDKGHGEASEPSSTSSAAPTQDSAAPTTPTPSTPDLTTGTSTEAGISDAELDALTAPDTEPPAVTPPTGGASGQSRPKR